MNEKRSVPRQRTFKGGAITLPTGIVECIIRNLSDHGALLELKEPALIPEDFWLVIKPELIRRHCCVTRRSGLEIGVMFIST